MKSHGPVRRPVRIIAVVLPLVLAACSDDDTGPAVGAEKGRCYPNKTCNPGLVCLSELCVRAADGGPPDARLDAPIDAGPQPDAPLLDGPLPDQGADLIPQPDASWTPPSWSQMQSQHKQTLFDVWGTGPGDVYAVGSGGAVLHFDGSKPSAFSWWAVASTTTGTHRGVWGFNPNDVYVFGSGGAVNHFDGKTWTPLSIGAKDALQAPWGSAAYGVIVPGSSGGALFHNARKQWPPVWTKQTTPQVGQLFEVWGSGPADLFAVGDQGTILRYDGTSWNKMVSGTTASLLAVWGSGPADVIAVGSGGTILYYDGTSWKQMISNTTEPLNDVWGSSAGNVFAVGNAGTIMHYDGTSWKSMVTGTTVALHGVWGSGPADVFAVGDQGTILHYGSCDCTVNSLCYGAGERDDTGCKVCDPQVSATTLVPFSGGCTIAGSCYKSGETDAAGCKVCDSSKSTTAWSTKAGVCDIGGTCHAAGAGGPASCQTCAPSKSTTAWTPTGTGCLIDLVCHATGAKDPTGCASCDPSVSKTSWTVVSNKCVIGSVCLAPGAVEPGGCGTCDPTKDQTAWTRGPGCLVTHLWSRSFGGTGSDHPFGVAVDAGGNVYVTGAFYTSINFGGATLASKGKGDIFIASFTPSGKHRWSKSFGSLDSDTGHGVETDASGNVYLTGSFSNTINFGGTTLSAKGSGDVYVASFTSSGAHRWSQSYGSTNNDLGEDIAVDSSGNVYVTGTFNAPINFGGTTLASISGYDVFVASFSSSGAHRWSKGFGGLSSDYGRGVETDASGNVYLTGVFANTINFGGTTLSTKGNSVYVASFSSSGAHRWSQGYGATGSSGYDIAVDSSGNVYVTGDFYASINFGGATLTSKGGGDIYLASFTPAGVHRWSKGFGGTSGDYGHGVACDPTGNVYLTGSYSTTVNFGGTTLSTKGNNDIYVASFTSSGAHRWSRTHGSTSGDHGRSVAVDGAGNTYVVGDYSSTVDFGGGPLTCKGVNDIALVKVGP